MKTTTFITSIFTFCLSHAATFQWDADADASNGAGGGTGTWNSSLQNWYNGSADVAWPNVTANDDKAEFGGTAGTVTLASSLTAGGIAFKTNNYALNGASADLTLNTQSTGSDAIVVASGVTGTSINLRRLILGSIGAGNPGDIINSDLINFNNTVVCFSGSRQMIIENSSTSATTTFGRFAIGSGTPGAATLQMKAGNITINALGASSNSSGLTTINSTALTPEIRFSAATGATGTQIITINGDNTLFNNAGTGNVSVKMDNPTGTMVLGHNNALGARDASGNLTDSQLRLNAGTIASNGSARTIENRVELNGTAAIGGSDNFTITGTITNNGGNRTLNFTNTAATTLSGTINLANDNVTARVLTLGGAEDATLSGAIVNNSSGNTVASALTLSGTGTITLTGTSTYTGATTVSAGTLLVEGALGSTAVSVGSAGIIGGSGSIDGTLDFASGAKLSVNLADPLTVTGAVTFADFDFDDLVGFDVETAATGTYTILSGSNINFTNIQHFDLSNAYTRPSDSAKVYFHSGSLAITITAVPETSTMLAFFSGAFVILRRRR